GTFSAIPATFPIGEGVLLTTGRALDVLPWSITANWNNWPMGADPDLNALDAFSFAGNHDACVLEFDMSVTGDSVSFDYVFGSMEYNEYAGSQYNDIFAFFISGPGIAGTQNLAMVPGTNDLVRVATVNCDSNSQYYICNTSYDDPIIYLVPCDPGICPDMEYPWMMQYDGYTTVFTAKAAVQPCETYHLKLAIQDNSDPYLDAGVFIRKSSINSNAVIITAEVDFTDEVFGEATAVEGCIDGKFKIELADPATTSTTVDFLVGGTAEQGIDYDAVPTSVTFAPGESVQYVDINVIADGVPDPDETVFLYQLSSCTGLPIDTAILYITDVFNAETVADTGVCLGQPVFLSVNGGAGITYAWSPAAGLTCTDCQYPFATASENTTYTVVISSAAGCTATDEMVISINPNSASAGEAVSLCGYTTLLQGSDPLGTAALWTQLSSSSGGTSTFDNANAQSTNVTVTASGDYLYVYTVGDGCQNMDTVQITFGNPEATVVPADTAVCPGNCVTLTTTTANPQTFSVDTSVPIPDGDQNGIYSLVELSGYCTDSITLDNLVGITVNIDHPSVSDIKIGIVAPDGTAMVLAYDNGTFFDEDYTNTTFAPTATASINTAAAPFTGSFLPYQSFNNLNGVPLNGTWQLWVVDLWGASSGFEGTLLNWSITFNTNTYAWSPAAGLSATDIPNPEACPTDPTTYMVVVTNDCGCADTATAFVNTAGGLQTTLATNDASCNQFNGSAEVTVVGGAPPYTYAWSTGDTTPTLSNLAAGMYIATATDATGCNAVDTVVIGVSDGPVVTDSVSNATCNQDDGAIDISVAGGSAPYEFSWSNGALTEDLSALAAGVYDLTVLDANGCSSAQSFTVTQDSCGGVLTIALTASGSCDSTGASIDATITGGTPPYTVTWSNGETTEDLSGLAAGTYTVTVNDAAGEALVDSIDVITTAALIVSLNVQAATCNQANGGIEANVSNGTAPFSFSWSNGTTDENLTNIDAGSYAVTVTDANGCSLVADTSVATSDGPVAADSIVHPTCGLNNGLVELEVSGGALPYTYSWSNGGTDQNLSDLTAGTYTVTVTDALLCSVVQSFDLIASVGVTISVASIDPACGIANGSIDASVVGGALPYAFTWSNGETDEDIDSLTSGLYGVTVVDASGCNDTVGVSLTEQTNAQLELNGLVDSLCVGESFTVSAAGFLNYTWSPAFGLSSNTGNSVVVTAGESQTYTVIGSSGLNCADTVSFSVTVVPAASVLFSDTFSGCAPLDVLLQADVQNAVSVQWWINGALASTENPAAVSLAEGTHDALVVAVSPAGCNDTILIPEFAEVFSSPQADFDAALAGTDSTSYTFQNNSIGANTFSWNFGDGLTDTVASPQHTYRGFGSYLVVLTATNAMGCSDTAQGRLFFAVPREVFIPNTFTPNGDGANEFFGVYGHGIESYRLRVFDRWGELVFDEEGVAPYWDGSFKGQPMNMTTCVYLAEVEFLDGRREKYWGDVNIIR
ncbi:MAG TPA: choice-of-anchor L domain-containing protein, partial [Chitinophagales bacterium]|nr:choice-of-anchor L domain-containing protein [Chitinophagales bacterium]